MPLQNPEYIGDGVYVGHDGYQLWLYANHHETPTDKIALTQEVYAALLVYVDKMAGTDDAEKI